MTPITLAITTFNRFDLLVQSFEKVIDDPRLKEIVIVDDDSDMNIFQQIVNEWKDHPKVQIFRNASNVGVYRNKYHSVFFSKSDWVIVFDSDNVIDTDYIDALYSIEEWHEHIVYCPEFAKPKFDYRHFNGQLISRSNAAFMFKKKQFDCLINTMNCFVNRNEFLKVFDNEIEPSAADSAYFNYKWLMAGNEMWIVPGLQYEHRIHNGSHYVQNIAKSNAFHSKMMDAFKYMK